VDRRSNGEGSIKKKKKSGRWCARHTANKNIRSSDYATIVSYDKTERRPTVAYLEGQLRRRTEEAEDEHTGYLLEVEVDMSAVDDVEEVVDGQVAVTGEVEFVDYPERGKILVFRVASVAEVEE
jgi:hypothetical protein